MVLVGLLGTMGLHRPAVAAGAEAAPAEAAPDVERGFSVGALGVAGAFCIGLSVGVMAAGLALFAVRENEQLFDDIRPYAQLLTGLFVTSAAAVLFALGASMLAADVWLLDDDPPAAGGPGQSERVSPSRATTVSAKRRRARSPSPSRKTSSWPGSWWNRHKVLTPAFSAIAAPASNVE